MTYSPDDQHDCSHANYDDYLDRCEDCGYEPHTLEQITNSPVYKQILKDSFGGVLYNVANRDKYDTTELLRLWKELTPGERNSVGGIMQGAFNFLTSEV